jgi:peptidoglycan/xylan/chitin deacetylase (PgdA/CDA1 family)
MWSKDTIDWRDKDKDLIIKRATKEVRGGDLILMHPKAHTLGALKEIISIYKKIGLKVVTVSENLA